MCCCYSNKQKGGGGGGNRERKGEGMNKAVKVEEVKRALMGGTVWQV